MDRPICDRCEEAREAVCTINMLVCGYGGRKQRKQATVKALHLCRVCARDVAKMMTRDVARTGLHVALDHVIG